MGLLRLLFWIAIIFAAIWVWRRFFGSARPRPQQPTEQQPSPMVRCAHCGVHTPQNHALNYGEHWYCSQPHLDKGPGSGAR